MKLQRFGCGIIDLVLLRSAICGGCFLAYLLSMISSYFKCGVCEMAKSHRTSFQPSLNKSSIPFMILHSDVWGPSNIATLGGAHWFVTFIDDCTHMT